MGIRSTMIMRATTQRNSAAGITDNYGNSAAPAWADYLTALPCRVWHPKGGGEDLKREDKNALIIDSVKMICPLGTDIVETDRISTVKDRQGNQLFGAFIISSKIRRRADHLEMVLTEVN
jgi:hypothetical protein